MAEQSVMIKMTHEDGDTMTVVRAISQAARTIELARQCGYSKVEIVK